MLNTTNAQTNEKLLQDNSEFLNHADVIYAIKMQEDGVDANIYCKNGVSATGTEVYMGIVALIFGLANTYKVAASDLLDVIKETIEEIEFDDFAAFLEENDFDIEKELKRDGFWKEQAKDFKEFLDDFKDDFKEEYKEEIQELKESVEDIKEKAEEYIKKENS